MITLSKSKIITDGDKMNNNGVIYILTNPSFPEYVKIGYADDIEKRLQQLNRSECIPFAFRVYATYEVTSRLSDLKIHSIIDKLNPNLRSIENFNGHKRIREFYAMSAEDAYSILEAIAEIHGCVDKLKLIKPQKQRKQLKKLLKKLLQKHKNVPRISRFRSAKFQLVRHLNFAMEMFQGFFVRLLMIEKLNIRERKCI